MVRRCGKTSSKWLAPRAWAQRWRRVWRFPRRPGLLSPTLDSFSASCSGRGRASQGCLRPPLPAAAALPRSGAGTRRGRAAGAGRGWEGESQGKEPLGHRGLRTRPERGNAPPAPGGSQALQALRLPREEGPRGPQRPPRRSNSQRPQKQTEDPGSFKIYPPYRHKNS